jgi:hypothetical protein
MLTLQYVVTIQVNNAQSIEDNARMLADNITGWKCSAECKGSPVVSVVVTAAATEGGPALAYRTKDQS